MRLQLESPVLALEAGEVFSLDDAEGVRIASRRGTVWITEEGNVRDRIVRPGEAVLVSRAGRTVVQAIEPAFVSLSAAGVSGPGPRIAP